MKKLSNAEAELKESVAYEKSLYTNIAWGRTNATH